MVEVFPVVSVHGLSPITASYPFRFIYGFGRYYEIYGTGELMGVTYSIPSSDMNLISPPGNAPLKLCAAFRWNTSSTYGGVVVFNDFIDILGVNEVTNSHDMWGDTRNHLGPTVRANNYIYAGSSDTYIRFAPFYYFLTNKVDYAKFGVWSKDDWQMTDGNPFSYVDFFTSSTSYTDLLTIDLLKPIVLNKMGFWLGLWVSSRTGYLRCVISEDGSTWNTLFEISTTSTSEVSVKVPILQDIRTRYIKLQCYNTSGANTYLRVRELHFWGDYQW
jgi:hypothetical protein